MISFFKVVDHVPTITEEAMLHKVVRDLFELKYNKGPGDSQGRERKRALAEMSFVFFLTDYRSQYSNWSDKDRYKQALIAAGFDEDYKISPKLQAVIDYMLENRDKSRKLRALESTQHVIDKLTEYFYNVDFNGVEERVEEGENGDLITIPGKEPDDAEKVVRNVSKLGALMKTLDELEEQVKKDMEEVSQYRGDAVPGRL